MSSEDGELPGADESPRLANTPSESGGPHRSSPSDSVDVRLAAIDCVFADAGQPDMAELNPPPATGGRRTSSAHHSAQGFVTHVSTQSDAATSAASLSPPLAQSARPRPPRKWLPRVLFVATCLTTCWAGACQGDPLLIFYPLFDGQPIELRWIDGLCYMAAVMAILFAHEMGHYLQALRYNVPASLPYFLPMPLTPIGTMGAVIRMHGGHADRKQLFDIGISGPLAGLVLAVPIALYGIATAVPVPETTLAGRLLQNPWFFQSVESWLRPDLPAGMVLDRHNPFWMAGWVGMLITGLNMLPLSQLDGGHISYALLGKRAHLLARFLLLAIAIFILRSNQYAWCVMFVLVMVIGADHPPTADDHVPLGWKRLLLGWLSLLIPVLCLAPVPVM